MATLVAAQSPARLVLATTIDTQRQVLLRGVTRSGRPKAKRVHDVRVAIRRLLVALDLATSTGQTPRPRTRRRLKRLLDGLSPLRDTEVQLKALPPLATSHPQAEELGKVLRARKRDLEREAAKQLAKFEIEDFERDLQLISGALSTAEEIPPGEVLEAALAGELAKRHLRAARDWQAASAQDPKSLHRVRLSLKGYRYALDALVPILPGAARELSARVARLQDQLGVAHDAHVLAETARESAKAHGARHQRQLEALASDLEKTSRAAQQNSESTLRSTRLEWPLSSAPNRQ